MVPYCLLWARSFPWTPPRRAMRPRRSLKTTRESTSTSNAFILIEFRNLSATDQSQPHSLPQSLPHSFPFNGGGRGPSDSLFFLLFARLSPLKCAVEHPTKDASPEGVSRPKDLSLALSPLQCAVPQFWPISPLECAVPKTGSYK